MKNDAPYTLVLTHDVDHLFIRHMPFFSKTAGSFIKRCMFSNLARWLKKDLTFREYLRSFFTGLLFPLIKIGMIPDPWEKSLDLILGIEKKYDVRSTFYFIPFYRTQGFIDDHTPAPERRGTDYDVRELRNKLEYLEENGWEVGIHGINAHLSVDKAAEELAVFKTMLPGKQKWGLRIHWLYQPPELWENLRNAGYNYDATFGSNDDVGFMEEKYHPFEKSGLAVLPLNIQDGSLLAHWHQSLTMDQAWERVKEILETARKHKAVVTILWHNVSFTYPRCWQNLYTRIIEQGKADGARFMTAIEAVENR